MRPADLARRTSVRLALGFAVVLIAAFALAGGVAYALIRDQLLRHEDRRILQTVDTIAAEAASGPAALAAAVTEQVAVLRDLSVLIQLRDATGARVAGNGPRLDAAAGWSDLPPGTAGLPDDVPYRVYVATVGTGRLLVAHDTGDLEEIAEIVAGALGWASLAVLIVALGGGAAIASRVQPRMDRMAATLHRVAEGDLGARIPVEGTGDLARLAGGINAALIRLEGLIEGMRQVSTDIAHDLRTPLARLRLRIERAAGLARDGSPLAAELEAALADSDALDATFAALLRIAQIEAGARRARFATVDLGAVMDRLAEAYVGVAEDAGQALTFASPGRAPVLGDRDLLMQLFANLIENAVRYGPPGNAICCAVAHHGGQTTATVRDAGPGIPAAERDRVLRRLYRMEKSRTSPGAGLGLALVKAVADLHGAALMLDDAAPGLVVTVAFPGIDGAG